MTLPPMFASEAGQALIENLATEFEVDRAVLHALLEARDRHSGKLRRKGLFQSFDAILDAKEA
jgi:hypothetical protein